MSGKKRVRRPVLDRTRPIRSWSSSISAGPERVDRVIRDGVGNANRVVEEYLRAGESSARRFERAFAADSGDSPDLVQRMVRASSDAMSFWMELFTRAAQPAERQASATAAPTQPAHGPDADPAQGLNLSVEIDCPRPVTLTVHLRSRGEHAGLSVDRLHPRHAKAAPIRGVEIEPARDGTPVAIRVRVAPEQEPGVYRGVILEGGTSRPVGTIALDLQSSRSRPARSRTVERRRDR